MRGLVRFAVDYRETIETTAFPRVSTLQISDLAIRSASAKIPLFLGKSSPFGGGSGGIHKAKVTGSSPLSFELRSFRQTSPGPHGRPGDHSAKASPNLV